ncbi:hypothetical protein [Cereibacter sphaeroides]|uniref:hypothetical protein n=1 Tax=Cereibacter sphaeroides TaxID=1063 RepID=UPI003FCD7E31
MSFKPKREAARSLPQQAEAAPLESLAHLLAEMQGLALVIPAVDRTDAEIEADFDNMPV